MWDSERALPRPSLQILSRSSGSPVTQCKSLTDERWSLQNLPPPPSSFPLSPLRVATWRWPQGVQTPGLEATVLRTLARLCPLALCSH